MRPSRSATQQQTEIRINLEQQILDELAQLREGTDTVKGQIRDLRTVLMGQGEAGETPFGRLPMVETSIKDLSARVTNLEKNSTLQAIVSHAAVAVLAGAGGYMLQHFFGILGK